MVSNFSAEAPADQKQVRAEPRSALQVLGRALFASPLEICVGLSVIAVGIAIKGIPGQLLTGLGGILISYSTTLSVAEARARRRHREEVRDQRDQEVHRLRGIYRQIYNTHIQILEATTDPDDRLTSFALITQSNRNLFFLLTEIEAIVGELDIRVASLTNRLRSNMQEMEVLLASEPDSESAERLALLEREQITLKQQLASVTGAEGPSAGKVDLQVTQAIVRTIAPPDPGSTAGDWLGFLRVVVARILESAQLDGAIREGSLPLTLLGHVLRANMGHSLPTFPGHRGLADLLTHALADTQYCVVRGVEDSLFRGVAYRSKVPPGLEIMDAETSFDPDALPEVDSGSGPPLPPASLPGLDSPDATTTVGEWIDFLRQLTELAMRGRSELSLQRLGTLLKSHSELPLPRRSGLQKLSAYLQIALADSEYCVVEKSLAELVVAPRTTAPSVGTALPDMMLVDEKPRIIDAGPEFHTVEGYTKIARYAMPALGFPQPDLPRVVEYLATRDGDELASDEVVATLADPLDKLSAESVRSALALLQNARALRLNPDGKVTILVSGPNLFEHLEAVLSKEVRDRLGTVEADVVHALVVGDGDRSQADPAPPLAT